MTNHQLFENGSFQVFFKWFQVSCAQVHLGRATHFQERKSTANFCLRVNSYGDFLLVGTPTAERWRWSFTALWHLYNTFASFSTMSYYSDESGRSGTLPLTLLFKSTVNDVFFLWEFIEDNIYEFLFSKIKLHYRP